MNLLDLPCDEINVYLAKMAQSSVSRDRINFWAVIIVRKTACLTVYLI